MLHIISAFFHLFSLSIFYSQCLSACILHWNFFLDRSKGLLYTVTAYYEKTKSFRCQSINVNNNSSCENCNTVILQVPVKVKVIEYSYVISSIVLETLYWGITGTLYRIELLKWTIVTKGKFIKGNFSAFARWHL